jgi:hypothetical protein
MDRTSAQPQVNLSLLRSNSLKFQPLDCGEGWGGGGVHWSSHHLQRENEQIFNDDVVERSEPKGISPSVHQVLPSRGFELMPS